MKGRNSNKEASGVDIYAGNDFSDIIKARAATVIIFCHQFLDIHGNLVPQFLARMLTAARARFSYGRVEISGMVDNESFKSASQHLY